MSLPRACYILPLRLQSDADPAYLAFLPPISHTHAQRSCHPPPPELSVGYITQ